MKKWLLAGAVAVLVASVTLAPAFAQHRTTTATDLTPHIRPAHLTNFSIDTTTMPGHHLLRYQTKIVNVGAGAFELRGNRLSTSVSTMSVVQRIYDNAGGHRDVPVSGTMVWGGDGHNHWHFQDLELGKLARLDNGVVVGSSAKHGLLLFDNSNYNATAPAFYTQSTSCASGNPNALSAVMGLTVGWADVYAAPLNYQWIDITGLKSGKYRLTQTTNPNLGLTGVNTSDNWTTADLRINGGGVTVLSRNGGLP